MTLHVPPGLAGIDNIASLIEERAKGVLERNVARAVQQAAIYAGAVGLLCGAVLGLGAGLALVGRKGRKSSKGEP